MNEADRGTFSYGVEYKCRGAKPPIPGDVLVDIAGAYGIIQKMEVSRVYWPDTYSFIIVDERYKCVNDLPPIGSKVVYSRNPGFTLGRNTKAWEYGDEVEVISHQIAHGTLLPICWNPKTSTASSVVLECLRPLGSKEIDALSTDILRYWNDKGLDCDIKEWELAEHLYELGYRKVQPMTESEFVAKAVGICGTGIKFKAHELYAAGCCFKEEN